MSGKGTRILQVFKALHSHPLIGISNKEIADNLGFTPTQVSRDLADLISEGLVQKLDNGNYAYSIRTLQIAENYRKQHERLKARMDEIQRNVGIGY